MNCTLRLVEITMHTPEVVVRSHEVHFVKFDNMLQFSQGDLLNCSRVKGTFISVTGTVSKLKF